MIKRLLSCMALVGLMQVSQAAEPTDVTASYLQNYSAPFEATGDVLIPNLIASGERFQ